MNMVANGVLRLLGIEPKDEVHSSFTREEVAALVEESRGEGLIEADEYDRLAGALGFTEKAVTSILMPPDTPRHRAHRARPWPTSRRCARRPASAASRWPPPTAPSSATSTSRTSSRPTTTSARGPSRTSGSVPSPRSAPTTCSTTRSRACRSRAPTWRGSCSRDGAVVGLVTLEDVLEELVGEIRDAAHHDVSTVDAG